MRGHPCWECGKPAPGGVCLGPHPGFQMNAAVRVHMVMHLDRPAPVESASSDRRNRYRREYYQENKERIVAQFRLAAKVREELRWNRELRELAGSR